MSTDRIYEDCPLYTAFPDSEDVFHSSIEVEHLLPLGILHISDSPQGDILIAVPCTNEEGFVAKENSGSKYGEFWLTYKRSNGKWKLDIPEEVLYSPGWYSESAKKSLSENKEIYKENGALSNKYKTQLFKLEEQASNYSNWYQFASEHIEHNLTDSDGSDKMVTLFDEGGSEYTHLGYVDTCSYSSPLSAQVYVFYCKDKDKVLVISEY